MKRRFYRNNDGCNLITGGGTGQGTAAQPTTQSVAMNSQAEQLQKTFQQSTYIAMSTCNGGQAVKTISLETRFLNAAENPNPQFSIENNAAGNQKVIIGSVLALQGAYQFYNQSASAADSVNMIDDYGANMKAMQGFANLTNFTPVILVEFQVMSTSQPQIGQALNYSDLSYDATVNKITLNVTKTFTRFDTNTGIVNYSALWPIGPQTFLSFMSLNNVDLVLTVTMGSTSSVRTFRQING